MLPVLELVAVPCLLSAALVPSMHADGSAHLHVASRRQLLRCVPALAGGASFCAHGAAYAASVARPSLQEELVQILRVQVLGVFPRTFKGHILKRCRHS